MPAVNLTYAQNQYIQKQLYKQCKYLMYKYYSAIKYPLFLLPPETAHNIVSKLLQYNLLPKQPSVISEKLRVQILNQNFATPLGLAAGFDKNGACLNGLYNQGFSFVEVGTSTPLPQPGNPKPRLFRLNKQKAVINAMGFNNKGIDNLIQNIKTHAQDPNKIIGINIGRGKHGSIEDYCTLLKKANNFANYITINISSPNTPNLRDLEQKGNLETLLNLIQETKKSIISNGGKNTPILLKISPDLDDAALENIAQNALQYNMDGIITTNTSIGIKQQMPAQYRDKAGGLSGEPLLQQSTMITKKLYKLLQGKIPLIGVGGISSANDAYDKIKAGASLIQIYSSIIYQGFHLTTDINRGLLALIEKDGLKSIQEAVGVDVQ